VCWGCRAEWASDPILNLPVDTVRVRVRLRHDAVARAYVRTRSGIFCYLLKPVAAGLELHYPPQSANAKHKL